jgi:hypothetical protein
MRRYSRAQLLERAGAEPEDLQTLERRLVIQPRWRWLVFGKFVGPVEYYTESELRRLRCQVYARRTLAINR